jgi:micrococcal nuclease
VNKVKYTAEITRVVDGDTVHATVKFTFIETELSQEVIIRMNRIDAPETKGKEKVLGEKAKVWLKKKIEGKEIEIELLEKDFYKRWLAELYVGGQNLNDLMVKEKLVEIYTVEGHDDGKLDV